MGISGEVYEALLEICNNAIEHGGTGHGFATAQVYRHGHEDQRIDFAIGDSGIGIRESLTKAQFKVRNDRDALELALTSDVSSSREPGRGHGLPDVTHNIVAVGGTVTLRSGSARIKKGWNGVHHRDVQEMAGTVFGASIPCPPTVQQQ